jgi:hypothetical protein
MVCSLGEGGKGSACGRGVRGGDGRGRLRSQRLGWRRWLASQFNPNQGLIDNGPIKEMTDQRNLFEIEIVDMINLIISLLLSISPGVSLLSVILSHGVLNA